MGKKGPKMTQATQAVRNKLFNALVVLRDEVAAFEDMEDRDDTEEKQILEKALGAIQEISGRLSAALGKEHK